MLVHKNHRIMRQLGWEPIYNLRKTLILAWHNKRTNIFDVEVQELSESELREKVINL